MAQTIKSKVLQHYDRMIAWAEKQTETWYYSDMKRDLGEAPISEDCVLCARYRGVDYFHCVHCPVRKATGRTGCVDTPYIYIVTALTKGELLAALKAERAFLASLKYGKER